MSYLNYNLPVEYTSLGYLHTKLGDVKVVECVCHIWNQLNAQDTLIVLEIDKENSRILITGKCVDSVAALKICKYLTSFGVDIQHIKTFINVEV
jgi:hypothetical protein